MTELKRMKAWAHWKRLELDCFRKSPFYTATHAELWDSEMLFVSDIEALVKICESVSSENRESVSSENRETEKG